MPIKFILDLDAKLGRLPTADRVLGRIAQQLARLDPGMKQTLRGFNALLGGANLAGRAFGGFREGVNMAGRQVGQFGRDALAHFTALASFNGLLALSNAAIHLGKSLITTVANGERADAVMKSLVGPEMFGRLDGWAEKLSKVTEFDDDDIKRFASGLLKVGFAAKQLPVSLAIASDIAALTDADPVQTLREVGSALERVKTKGGLDMRILTGLGISREDFFGPLAKKLGLSIDDVEKRVNDGKVKLPVLLQQMKDAIKKKSGKGLGEVALERGKGFSATLSRLGRVPEDIFKEFKGTDASKRMAETFERLAEVLGPKGPVGSKIVAGIGVAFDTVSKWLANTDFNKVIGDVKAFGESASQVFGVVATAAKWVWKAFDFVGTTIGKTVGQVFLEFENLMKVGTKIGDFFGSIDVVIKDWSSRLFEGAKFMGIRIWEGIKSGITEKVSAVGGAMSKLLESLMGTTEEKLQIHSPSRVFERYGALTGEGFAKGLADKTRDVEASVKGTYSLPAPSADLMLGAGANAASKGRRQGAMFTVPITINYTGSGGPEAAREIGEVVKQILPGQLQHAFSRLLVETGAG